MPKITQLHVNGTRHRIDVDSARSLLSVLRDELRLTGSKYGCGEGQCGACTVLIEGQAARSCITPVGSAAGKQITTIEGLEKNGRLHPLQEAFIEVCAMRCGYCTPGMIMSGVSLLKKNSILRAGQNKSFSGGERIFGVRRPFSFFKALLSFG
ncbi:MAG: (2Fe-2S)-binding protein, partial [Blastocatellia bacterium]|nr:(2Fe-2S)-binding protein [Blastocatellia bacterium]